MQVVVPGKGFVNVEFIPYSNYESGNGGSIFTTDNEVLQNAMESDHRFGSKYHLKSINGMTPYDWEQKKAAYGEDKTADEIKQAEQDAVNASLKHVQVSNIMDAKTYLIDNCNWEPKGRQTKNSIKDVAETYGIIFEGI